MQLPDESVEYVYQNAIVPHSEVWSALAELQAQNLIPKARLQALQPSLTAIRGQVAAEREVVEPKPEQQPLQAGFIDLPQKLLDSHRRKGEASELGRILALAQKLRDETDRVIVLGIGGSYMGARALFEALCAAGHNELPPQDRMGKPRLYFAGNGFDNDSLQELLDLLEKTCIDPDIREERWGVIVISKSGETLETAAAYRVFRAEAARFYGAQSPRRKQLVVPVTGAKGRMHELCKADGYADSEVLTIPDNIGGRYSIFTAVGLLPAATLGLDVRALLLGAAAMTKRFLEEPFERNPVLQYAAINFLMNEELHKDIRVMSVWSKKLEALGLWYDQLLSESLGKHGRGATPITSVMTRDLHSRGQQHQDGARDKMINNVFVKAAKLAPIAVGMADRNEDDLNVLARKTYPDMLQAAFDGTNQAYREVARPTADIVLPALTEHTVGQVMQMLMLATVVEGRLMGVNPYGQPGVEAYKKNMMKILKGS
ncbi:MAG: glucose-6-phosphate isomerase [Gemmataceae bacterium]